MVEAVSAYTSCENKKILINIFICSVTLFLNNVFIIYQKGRYFIFKKTKIYVIFS